MRIAAILITCVLAVPALASADVITFDTGAGTILDPTCSSCTRYAWWYREGAMDVRSSYGTLWLFGEGVQFNADGNGLTFRLTSGGTFDLQQLTVVNGGFVFEPFIPSIFQSSKGATVTLGPGTFSFLGDDWKGITSFTWSMPMDPDFRHTAIDNVIFQVPEPALFTLACAATGSIWLRRRKRRNATD